ncbi:sorting nexin-11-like isoform X1 [Acipenser oxyrinchus oxyrinchus]|uniref:Sorting nexin-11-like isoform X1 n=1 Tax=Acipenser oxyrinchus oxyrinchus TaxID=40147 RepID=A0AAD8D0L5_ACIOX|nr:sorting nexin-11-like isoform X1 [Acipenser oxyrinchus oxyrinchus]
MSLCLPRYQDCSRMITNQEQEQEEEFIAVRVQDPRIQNKESWYSYVDFKIFLHSNSKAFTAKTSCVRRRYSEFVWLKKKLQKNAGLVPVPELPPKTPFFSVGNEDFIEKRRQGLQQFLEKVVNRTVFLSDSQLHLFLQTQLSPEQIEACVQGHAPYGVTTAILRYASSNQGWAQEEEGGAAEEDCERTLPVFYESPDSLVIFFSLPLSQPHPRHQPSECKQLEISLVESDAHTGSDDQSDSRD